MESPHASRGVVATLFGANVVPISVNEQGGLSRHVSRLLATVAVVVFTYAQTAHAQGPSLVADFNGDGIDDLAVAAPRSNDFRGSVSIFLGVAGGFTTTAPTTPNWTVLGPPNAIDGYGDALAAADFNRDGRSELVVGAPLWNGNRGRIEILAFQPATLGRVLISRRSYSQDTLDVAGLAEPDDRFGYALTTGDFDGNGYPDLAVGVPQQDVGAVPNAGAVHVFYARSDGIRVDGNRLWSQAGSGILDEPQPGDQFGSALAAGDFNGDGIDDVAVGVPFEDLVFINQGAVNVIFGTPSGLSTTGDHFLAISESALFSGAQLGSALAAGDINGDGFADLAIGAPNGVDASGFFAVSYGAAGGLGALFVHFQSIDPPDAGDRLGSALTIADFNGDGFGDVAAGAPFQDLGGLTDVGAVTVFYGQGGFSMNRQELWHQNTYGVKDKIEPADLFGASLAAGDYNADGFPDLAIGVPREDIGTTVIVNAGAVNLIVGTPGGLYAGINHLLIAAPTTRTAYAFFGLVSQ